MKVTIDKDKIFFTFSPATLEEYDALVELSEALRPGDELIFIGKKKTIPPQILPYFIYPEPGIDENDPQSRHYLDLGFKDKTIQVMGTSQEDDFKIQDISFPLVFMDGKLVFASACRGNNTISVSFLSGACEKCGGPCVGGKAIQFMCDGCAAKCVHVFKFYLTMVLPKNEKVRRLGVSEFCEFCKRKNPDFLEGELTKEEHQKLVFDIFGLLIKYPRDLPKRDW